MARRLEPLTLATLGELPAPCRDCVFWELDPVAARQANRNGDTALEKEAWLSQLLLDWGPAGVVLWVDEEIAGYAVYAPATYLPRVQAFPTAPVSADAVVLATGRILPRYLGLGLGKVIVQAVAKDILKRGFRAIEAFGDSRWDGPGCVWPTDFLQAVGFAVVREHPRNPRLRLDLRSAITWRSEMEAAVERLMGAIRPEHAPPVTVRDAAETTRTH
ncbi:GNAT family N-acetyltransferase [Kribbella sandramycini]|uniref:GNAT family N-acetyltransferase n=1 Tax=Kribbella sandramycini TaxID=60450 RepID=A0A7Y4NZA0_9ACTN|nr:GNAT family N-acetyltransferase [Kribbella sandramycini]MBB6565541.1 GNAT superfamily N-acetyltransferase [Kribbella sandramycini]NOL41807.1 GNAT family N-acetyltransferase [Kribbella sandramycini]